MLLRGAVAVCGTQQQKVVEAHTLSARPIRFALPPPRLSNYTSRWLVTAVVMVLLMLNTTPCCCLEARCPAESASDSYCQCGVEEIRSGLEVSIKCDFQKEEVSVDYEVGHLPSF